MSLLVGLVAGLIGTAWFIYGRKQNHSIAMWAGAGLCVYPYFVGNLNWVLQLLIGIGLGILPLILQEETRL